MKYIVDIDGTSCTHDSPDTPYEEAKPIKERIHFFNQLFDAGHEIIYWTARGGNRGADYSQLTKKQLDDWGVRRTRLKMGKPPYDYWIDDKAFNVQDFFMTDIKSGETSSMTL